MLITEISSPSWWTRANLWKDSTKVPYTKGCRCFFLRFSSEAGGKAGLARRKNHSWVSQAVILSNKMPVTGKFPNFSISGLPVLLEKILVWILAENQLNIPWEKYEHKNSHLGAADARILQSCMNARSTVDACRHTTPFWKSVCGNFFREKVKAILPSAKEREVTPVIPWSLLYPFVEELMEQHLPGSWSIILVMKLTISVPSAGH